MLDFPSGIIGLPLRLLAREVYDKVSAQVGEDRVALITGEEKRVPRAPAYWVCTVESMPMAHAADFVAVDEIQLAAHPERGHVFTDRLLHARGRSETWFLGSDTMRGLIQQLVPTAHIESHPRLSTLSFSGVTGLSGLKPRSAIVAFSMSDVYALAERVRAVKGGTAVVLGALSPRARNAQVAMFQSGEVDYLVATDAIGMGLNLDLQHVAFAALDKFDGHEMRRLELGELGQIAGRAGRWLHNGSFGTLAPVDLPPFAAAAITSHQFPSLTHVRWRAHDLDFTSLESLTASLRERPQRPMLVPVKQADDFDALQWLAAKTEVRERMRGAHDVQMLWDVCGIPDFRKLLLDSHPSMLFDIFMELATHDWKLRDEWLAARVNALGGDAADVDTLTARLAGLRTWAYVANKSGWLADAQVWQAEMRGREDKLSDQLHEALVARFVVRENKRASARKHQRAVAATHKAAKVVDPAHPFAGLRSLRDQLAAQNEGVPEPDVLARLADAPHECFAVEISGRITAEYEGETRIVGRLVRGSSLLLPNVRLADLEAGAGVRARLERRLIAFARDWVSRLMAPVSKLLESDSVRVRSLAFALEQRLGSVPVDNIDIQLTARDREILRAHEVVLGRVSIYCRSLIEPAALVARAALVKVFYDLVKPLDAATVLTSASRTLPYEQSGFIIVARRPLRVDLAER